MIFADCGWSEECCSITKLLVWKKSFAGYSVLRILYKWTLRTFLNRVTIFFGARDCPRRVLNTQFDEKTNCLKAKCEIVQNMVQDAHGCFKNILGESLVSEVSRVSLSLFFQNITVTHFS